MFSQLQGSAQNVSLSAGNFEVGTNFGAMAFLGDLGGNRGVGSYFVKDYNLPVTRLLKGLFVTYYPMEWLGVKAQINHGFVEGDDNFIKDKGGDERFRKYRNLTFRSPILEGNIGVEIYPRYFLNSYDPEYTRFRPFIAVGAGFFRYNPQAKDASGNWVDLKPLRTEGQGIIAGKKEYSLFSPNILAGVGFKYMISEKLFAGLEVDHRFTFTDYIDDASTNYVDPSIYSSSSVLNATQVAQATFLNNRALTTSPIYTPPNINGLGGFSGIGAQRANPKNNDSYFTYHLKLGIRILRNENSSVLRRFRCPAVY
jgi:hypothetical protein